MTGNLLLFANSKAAARVRGNRSAESGRAQIVERICAGQREAFDELYKIFAPLVHGIVLARVPRDEADDIVQEVFLTAYKKIKTLRDPNAVGAWLAMIARNRATEFYRRADPAEELSDDLSGRDSKEAEAREVLSVIRSLPDTYKETLILRLVEGMTGPEIAEQTGLTPDSVRVNLHRGMKLLRGKLGIEEKK